MPGPLGCGAVYRAVIADRCGGKTLCTLDSATSVKWGRVRSGLSQATVTLAGGECCDCLDKVWSWGHSLTIFRDGDKVWGPGPVTNVSLSADASTVTGSDVSAWLAHRSLSRAMSFGSTSDVVDVAKALLDNGFGQDNPCSIKVVAVAESGVRGSRSYLAKSGQVLDRLGELATAGVDWTVNGDVVFLFGEGKLPTLGTVLREGHVTSGVTVTQDGDNFATAAAVSLGAGIIGTAGGTVPFFGLLETVKDSSTVVGEFSAAQTAAALITERPPVTVDARDAQLSPDAPVGINDLIPGVGIPIGVSAGCREVAATLRLSSLSVTWDAKGEAVTFTTDTGSGA